MFKPLLAVCTFTLTVLACSTNAPVQPKLSSPRMPSTPAYTAEENKWLTYCVGLTDTAWSVAKRKLAGAKREEVEAYYASKPDAQFGSAPRKLTSVTIDKVYGETFSNAWDYGVSFFGERASNMAHVPAARVRLGSSL